MIRRYQTRHDSISFRSNERTVSLALVGEIQQALLNHNFRFLLDATAYLIILFASARELVRSCVLLSSTYNDLPKNTIEMMLARIERKSMLCESPVIVPLSIERTMYFLSIASWDKAATCVMTHLDKNLVKCNPLMNTYAGLTHYMLWQKDKIHEATMSREGQKIGKSNTHLHRITDILRYFGCIYASKGVWDLPLHLHMKLLVEERGSIQAALDVACQNLDTNKGDLNAMVTLAELYIDFNESDIYSKEELVRILTRIHYVDPSNYLMIKLCQETGISEETSSFVVSVAMAFLDYSCNREEHKMWECLYDALSELKSSEVGNVLQEEWEYRRLWWDPLHFDIDNLIENFQGNVALFCYKASVLNKLNQNVTNSYSSKAKILLNQLTVVDLSLECISLLESITIDGLIPGEEMDGCVVLDFSKDLTDVTEEIGVTEEVELAPVPLAKTTKFFHQEDLATYCYVSDQCLMRQEIERMFYLRKYKSMGPPHQNDTVDKMECVDDDCASS